MHQCLGPRPVDPSLDHARQENILEGTQLLKQIVMLEDQAYPASPLDREFSRVDGMNRKILPVYLTRRGAIQAR